MTLYAYTCTQLICEYVLMQVEVDYDCRTIQQEEYHLYLEDEQTSVSFKSHPVSVVIRHLDPR